MMTKILISYSRQDGSMVDAVIGELAKHGYTDVFAYDIDEHGTAVGTPWHSNLMAEARTCDALIVLTGPASISSQRCTEEITVALQRPMPARVFELVVAGTHGNPLLEEWQRQVLTDRSDGLGVLIPAIAKAGFEPSERTPAVVSPYPGLRAFDSQQARFFYGREDIVTHIVRRLDGSTLPGGVMSVLGPSGVGKSSIVRAGVIPQLRNGRDLENHWYVCAPFTPGEKPLRALAARITEMATLIGSRSAMRGDVSGIEAALVSGEDPGPLLAGLLCGERDGRLLLVMDQAEELLARGDQGEVALLTTALGKIVEDRRAWLLYTLRSDFLTDLLRSVAAGRLVGESVLVPALRPTELSAAIVRPARLLGWEYQPEAVAEMIADTADSRSLPLLAYALDRLFRQVSAQDRPNRLITLADYTSIGRVRDVLTEQADIAFEDALSRVVEQLDAPTSDPRSAARLRVLRFLRRLVSIRDGIPVRRAVPLDSIDPIDRAILEPFVAKRVVSLTEHNTAEVTHEALLTHWPTLRDELDELREALQTRAEIERRAADWAQAREGANSRAVDDTLLPITRLLAFLDVVRRGADLEPSAESLADGWMAIRASLAALDLGEQEIEYVDRSLQGALYGEVARISRDLDTDPVRAIGELLGQRSSLQLAVMSMLVEAPDTSPLVELVHRAMAANPVHLLADAHQNGAWGTAWAPNGTRFATGGRDQTVRVWRLVDHGARPVLEMRHGMDAVSQPPVPGWVRSVAWAGNGSHILSVATDENLKVWDADNGGEVRSHNHPDRLWSVHTPIAGGPAATAGADGLVRLYPIDRRSREPVLTVPIGGGRLWAAALSPDARRVAAACEDHHAYVFTTDDPPSAQLRIPHPDKVRSIAWSPNGTLLGTGCQDGVARVFDATTGELRRELSGHTDQIRAIRWSPTGLRIATGSADLDIRVWDAATGTPVAVLRQHSQGVCALDWAPTGDRLLSAADDGTARVWKVGSEPTACVALGEPVIAIAWHTAQSVLAAAVAESKRTGPSQVKIVTADGNVEAEPVAQHPMPVLSLAWTSDDDLITGSADQTAARWRAGQAMVTYTGARDAIVMATPAPSGDLLLGAARDRVIRLWDNNGTLHFDDQPERHQSFLTDADWDATGRRFAVVSDDHQLSVHQVEGRGHTMTDAGGGLTSVAWNVVTDEIAVGRADGAVLIYDCTNGIHPTFRRQLRAHPQAITDLSWSLDGTLLCAASEDWQASIWDTRSGTRRTVLVGHTAPITGCVWTADREVATGGEDGRVRFWNVQDADSHPMAGLAAIHDAGPDSPGYLSRIINELSNRAGGRIEPKITDNTLTAP